MSEVFEFYSGLPIRLSADSLSFEYGEGMFGPEPEMRRLDAIRPSLRDPGCSGPDPVYGIVMDIGRESDKPVLEERMLLFGAVVYAAGALGSEPVRSQGHVHAVSPHSGWSAPEVFEIWSGTAIVYGQERAETNPGRCIAVVARPGDKVVMPPGWAHYVVNADAKTRMCFGALCDRQYGFDYVGVRAHGGLAWFPTFTACGEIEWIPNPKYAPSVLEHHTARAYPELGLDHNGALYAQFARDPESVMFVSEPQRAVSIWPDLVP